MNVATSKKTTARISVIEPDEDQLAQRLAGRDLTPELFAFLRNIVKTRKWLRKINIPSGHDDAAVVLVFTASLKDGGFEIFSELHVFLAGKVLVEKWLVCPEGESIAYLPKGSLRAIEIRKVHVHAPEVTIEFLAAAEAGQNDLLVRKFDFSADRPTVEIVPHPFLVRATMAGTY